MGPSLENLTLLAYTALKRYLAQAAPDPECTAAVRAVLESVGKRRGPEDTRTVG
ncbi:MAG TPA: hypothetical protein VKG80_02875 [Trebonia sp.]|nr:hypothetical protein [Trebonia sp.]